MDASLYREIQLIVSDPSSSLLRGVGSLTRVPVSVPSKQTSRWRRKFRKYCHWLVRQAANLTANAGIFALPPTPPLTTAETTALNAVAAALGTIGYIASAPAGGLPITPP
jgi:hypothetical protein